MNAQSDNGTANPGAHFNAVKSGLNHLPANLYSFRKRHAAFFVILYPEFNQDGIIISQRLSKPAYYFQVKSSSIFGTPSPPVSTVIKKR